MNWSESKFLIKANGQEDWFQSHASSACILNRNGSKIDLLITARDKENRSRIGIIEFDLIEKRINKISKKPIIKLGELGSFYDCGTSYPYVIENKLYFTGWTKGVTVPFYNQLGSAIFENNEYNIQMSLPLNILKDVETIGIGSVFVMKIKDNYYLYYTAFKKWKTESEFKHTYQIEIAISKDGYIWESKKIEGLELAEDENCQARPYIIKYANKYHMWYSSKVTKNKYNIKYASSLDGVKWSRDRKLNLNTDSNSIWDSESQSYPCCYILNDLMYLFYAGNEYGKHGFGYRTIKLSDLND